MPDRSGGAKLDLAKRERERHGHKLDDHQDPEGVHLGGAAAARGARSKLYGTTAKNRKTAKMTRCTMP